MEPANSMLEIIRQRPSADEKVEVLANILSTQLTAILNSLLTMLTALDKTPGFDREALRRDLEEIKALGVTCDVDQRLYGQTIDLIASRVNQPSK